MKIKKDVKKSIRYFIILIASIMVSFFIVPLIPIQINTTDSVKKGLYYIKKSSQYKLNDYVVFCLDDLTAKKAYMAKYINHGSCPGGYEPLLKKIIAVPGDYLLFDNNLIKTPSGEYQAPTFKKDKSNHSINFKQQYGSLILSGFWVYGDNNIRSFDSRYFGQIKQKQILYVAKPLFVF